MPFDINFSLAPPNSMGDAYNNMVVNMQGVPLGETPSGQSVARMLGFSDKDSIGPALSEVLQMAGMLNLGIMFARTPDNEVNVYLNAVDPTKPGLPPIKSMLIILERDLQAGKLGNVQIQVKSDKEFELKSKDETETAEKAKEHNSRDPNYYENTARGMPDANGLDNTVLLNDEKIRQQISDDTKNAIEEGRDINLTEFTTATMSTGGTGGNPWLSGNAYVVFLTTFMELQRVLMQSKIVQGNIELKSMEMTYQLAVETADMIMKIAEMNRTMHIAGAVMAGVSMAFSATSMVLGAIGVASKMKGAMELTQMSSAVGTALDKMVTSAIQAAQDIPIAEKEGAKEMLQAIRTLIQRQMEKAGEAFKSQEDMIQQLLQTLDKIRDALQQAIAGALRK